MGKKVNLGNIKREHWSGNLGFILAAAGSAVGLGNIWKFPYITGENGGGAFVLIYLICIAVIGLPVMLCEMSLGRYTQRNPVGAFKAISPENSKVAHAIGFFLLLIGISLLCFKTYGWGVVFVVIGLLVFKFGWTMAGIMGVVAGFIILSFYSVVAGWTIGYIIKSLTNSLHFQDIKGAQTEFINFSSFITDNGFNFLPVIYHFVFMAACVYIVYNGVKKGIERWSKILMPLLFLLLIVLILRGLSLKGAMEGVRFYLTPDFSKITPQSVLVALGHAFFSLSIGMGVMITYGSYVSKKDNLFLSSLSVVFLDTLVALLAGLAIFPAVFAQGFKPDQGPGLVFIVLPRVFDTMPAGILWAALFFLLLFVAALTSGISLLEVVVAYFIDELGWERRFATIVTGFVIFVLGCFSAISIHNWRSLSMLHIFFTKIFNSSMSSFFDIMDNLASNWMLPLGGLFISIFVGWIWGTTQAVKEIRHGSHNFADVHLISLLAGLKDDPSHNSNVHVLTLASLWGIFIRFISPVAIMIAFLHKIGWINL